MPPANFALVCKGVYRSGFPKKRNFPFLRKLGIKSVLYGSHTSVRAPHCGAVAEARSRASVHCLSRRTLVLEDYPEQSLKFFQEAGIRFLQHGVPGNKVQLPVPACGQGS